MEKLLFQSGALVLFLIWIHFLPFLAHLVFHDRFAATVDGGIQWRDGRPVFGTHKTFRGIFAAFAGALVAAPLLGIGFWVAGAAAALAMAGDLMTSFLKRRLDKPSGTPMFGFDHGLEALLPLLALVPAMNLRAWQGIAALAAFIPLGFLGSRFWQYILYRPSVQNYPRVIHAPTRVREWRACHMPSSRWHHWLNFENYFYYRVALYWFFQIIRRYDHGVRNVLAVEVSEQTLWFPDLPAGFDGYRILLLTDLHLDGLEPLTDVLIERVRDLEVDLCLIGGDIRMELYGPIAPSVRLLHRLVEHVETADGNFGVLGNHDCIEMLPDLEAAGVRMLVNDAQEIRRDGSSLWLVGVDDPHFYKCDDLEYACRDIPAESFRVLLAHSPEIYNKAVQHGIRLYLCGHTHGGQICLPGFGPVFTHSSAPRQMAAGRWTHLNMTGYTSRGAGASGVPLRFNCPGEIPLITLHRGEA